MTEQQAEYQPDTVPLGRRLPPELAGRLTGDNPYAGAGAGAGKDVPQPQPQPPPPLPPPAPPLPPEMPESEPESESEFMGQVIALAYAKGWCIYHTYDSRRSVAGFPDLLMLHPQHGQIVAELKTATGKLTPQQATWLLAFEQAGQKAAIWRPADLSSGLIGRWLAGAFAGAGAGQPQQAPPPDTPAAELPPCWNCGAAPRVTAASMLCAGCGGGGVA